MTEDLSPELQEVAISKKMCDLPAGMRVSLELPHSQDRALISQLQPKAGPRAGFLQCTRGIHTIFQCS